MIRQRLGEAEPQKPAQRQRVSGSPRDSTLEVEALEVADQQQAHVQPGRQAQSAAFRTERGALVFDECIESVRVEDLIETAIERMPARRGQLIAGTLARIRCIAASSKALSVSIHTLPAMPSWRMNAMAASSSGHSEIATRSYCPCVQ